jgi:hypothetical protein
LRLGRREQALHTAAKIGGSRQVRLGARLLAVEGEDSRKRWDGAENLFGLLGREGDCFFEVEIRRHE